MAAIARSAGLADRYVSWLLRCSLLAPDIVEALLAGAAPHDLTLTKVLNKTAAVLDQTPGDIGLSGNNVSINPGKYGDSAFSGGNKFRRHRPRVNALASQINEPNHHSSQQRNAAELRREIP